jgi:hypothetical protein
LGLVQVARTGNAGVRSGGLTGRVIVTIISRVVAGIGVIVTRPLVAAVVIASLIISITVSVRRRTCDSNVTGRGAYAGYGLRLNEVETLSIRQHLLLRDCYGAGVERGEACESQTENSNQHEPTNRHPAQAISARFTSLSRGGRWLMISLGKGGAKSG